MFSSCALLGRTLRRVLLLTLQLAAWSYMADAAPLSAPGIMSADRDQPRLTIAVPPLDPATPDSDALRPGQTLIKALWQEWGRRHRVAVAFVELSPEQGRAALQRDEIQVVAAVAYSDSLHQQGYIHSLPFMAIRRLVFVRDHRQGPPQRAIFTHDPELSYYPDLVERHATTAGFAIVDTAAAAASHRPAFDYIATLRPQQLAAALLEHGVASDYRYSDDELRPLPLRAMTNARHQSLITSFNQLLRQLDDRQLQRLWPHQGAQPSTMVIPLVAQLLPDLTAAQTQLVAEHPVIYYGATSQGYPPYVIRGAVDDRGFAIDLLDQIGNRLGVEFRPRHYPTLASLMAALSQGEIAVLPSTHTDEAPAGSLLTSPYDHQQQVLVVPSEHLITAPEALLAQTEVVVRGTPMAAVKRPANNPLVEVDTIMDAFVMVDEGRADFLRDEPVHASYMINQSRFRQLALRPLPTYHSGPDGKRMLVSAHQPALLPLLEVGLASISSAQRLQLRTKWMLNTATDLAQQQEIAELRLRLTRALIGGGTLGLGLLLWQQLLLRRRRRIQWQIESSLAEARRARTEAEQLAQAKSLFMAKMSHEIRTPMNGVLGMAEALQATPIDTQQQELLTTLNSSARHLLALLNDVLDYAKMEAEQLVIEQIPFEFQALCRQVIDNYQHRASAHGLRLTLKLADAQPLYLLGDPTRLTQILSNLVGNALKFTHEGGVELRASADAVAADGHWQITLQVQDSGIGIAPERLATLFDPFTQADASTTRRYGGSGLGLAICRELVEAMAGTLEVSSMPGHGSLFTVRLPLPAASAAALPAKPPTLDYIDLLQSRLAGRPPLRVIVAEDHAVNLKVLISQLGRLGISASCASCASDGAQALAMYQQQPCDLLLSDCHMPNMDGFALAAAIRSQSDQCRPYLLALTADAQSDAAERCLQAGFDGYVAKPCPLAELARQLLQALDRLDWPQLAATTADALPMAPTPAASSASPLVDRLHTRTLVGDDDEVLAAVLDAYLEQQPQDRQALVTAADGLPRALMAHRLKGSLRYFGATGPAAVAAAIEQAVADGQDSNALTQTLVEQLAVVAAEVHLWRQQLA